MNQSQNLQSSNLNNPQQQAQELARMNAQAQQLQSQQFPQQSQGQFTQPQFQSKVNQKHGVKYGLEQFKDYLPEDMKTKPQNTLVSAQQGGISNDQGKTVFQNLTHQSTNDDIGKRVETAFTNFSWANTGNGLGNTGEIKDANIVRSTGGSSIDAGGVRLTEGNNQMFVNQLHFANK